MDKRLAFLLNNSNDIFFVTDIDGNIISSNSSWKHFSGYTDKEARDINLINIAHPAEKNRIIELFKSIISLTNIEGLFVRIKAKDDSYLSISWSACFDTDEQLVYATGIYTDQNLNIRNPYNISAKVQHVLVALTEGFFMLDDHWRINAFNPAFQKIVNMPVNELYGADFRLIDKLALNDYVIPELEMVYKNSAPAQLQYYDSRCKGWLRLSIYPYRGDLVVFVRDVSGIKIEQLVLTLEKRVLERNFTPDYHFSKIADEFLTGIEEIFPEMFCSILEIDEQQDKVYHLSGPRLPEAYRNAIDGSRIGPKAGSCGTAAYHREQVIVKDIASSPLWEDYKEYILPYGFKACWSTPVISAQSTNVLATFAIYYKEIREPGKDELKMIDRTVSILRALIESKRNQAHLADQTKRLQEIASISSHNIRRPVATILGLTNLFDRKNLANPLNKEVLEHLETTTMELDDVIHLIVEKTVNI